MLNFFRIIKINILSLILLYGFSSSAKCIGFEEGTPNFCADIKATKRISMDNDSCIYKAEISNLGKTIPSALSFPFFEDKLSKEKEYIVNFSKEYCTDDLDKKVIRSVVVAICNDNVMMGRNFLVKLGILSPLPSFYVAEKPTVQIFNPEKIDIKEVSCSAK